MQAVPKYEPTDEEVSDFKIQVMAHIHGLYERIRLELLTRR